MNECEFVHEVCYHSQHRSSCLPSFIYSITSLRTRRFKVSKYSSIVCLPSYLPIYSSSYQRDVKHSAGILILPYSPLLLTKFSSSL